MHYSRNRLDKREAKITARKLTKTKFYNMTKVITVTRRAGKVDKVRALAVGKTAKHFDVDPTHVRKIAEGERNNTEIEKYYRKTYAQIKKVLTA